MILYSKKGKKIPKSAEMLKKNDFMFSEYFFMETRSTLGTKCIRKLYQLICQSEQEISEKNSQLVQNCGHFKGKNGPGQIGTILIFSKFLSKLQGILPYILSPSFDNILPFYRKKWPIQHFSKFCKNSLKACESSKFFLV